MSAPTLFPPRRALNIALAVFALAAAYYPTAELGSVVSAYRIPRRRLGGSAGQATPPGAGCAHLCRDGWLPTGNGGECGFDLMHDTAYLPKPDFFACASRWPSSKWARERQELLRYVEQLQSPPDCRDPGGAQWHLIKLTQFGLGTVVNMLVQTLRKAWLSGVPVIVSNSRMRYADEDAACGGGYPCFLRPLTPGCELERIPPQMVTTFDVPGAPATLAEACKPDGRYNSSTGRCDCAQGFLPARPGRCEAESGSNPRCREILRSGGAEAQRSSFQSCFHDAAPGETMNAQASPRAATKGGTSSGRGSPPPPLSLKNPLKHIEPAIAAHVLNSTLLHERLPPELARGGCIAVHIRHGDACSSYRKANYLSRTCFPPSAYLKEVQRVADLYGRRPVFLATDDPSVVEPMRRGLEAIGVETMLSLDIDRAKYNTTELLEKRDDMSGKAVAEEILLDVWAMSGCDMFVGSMAASPFLLAWNVAVGRKGYYPPFVSLETPVGDPVLWRTKHKYFPGGPMHGKGNCRCEPKHCPEDSPKHSRCLKMPRECLCDALLPNASEYHAEVLR